MGDTWDIPFNLDEIVAVESIDDIDILSDLELCLFILGQENPDEVLELESFLFETTDSADNEKQDLCPNFNFEVDPQHGQMVPASDDSGFVEIEDARDLLLLEEVSDLNFDVVVQHELKISESVHDPGYEGNIFSNFDYQFSCATGVNIKDSDFNVEHQLCQKRPESNDGPTPQVDDIGQEQNANVGGLYDEAITANVEYQKELRMFLEELDDKKLLLQKRIHILKEEIRHLEANHAGDVQGKAVSNLNFSQFGFPYFKGKDGKALGVYDEFLALNKLLKFKPTFDNELKPKEMLPKQKAKLKEAVLKDLVRIALEQLAISKENVEKILTEKAARGLPHKTHLNRLESLDKQIKEVNVDPEKWFKHKSVYQFELLDWEKIALEVFQNQIGYDAVFVRQWWKVQLDPSFQRGQLTDKEIDLLKKITKDYSPEELIDFNGIATQISTKLKLRKRHVFQLGKYFQRKLNTKNRNFRWPKEETERLILLHQEYSSKILSRAELWSAIRSHFPGRSISQMETKLNRLSTPTKCPPTAIKTVVTASKTPRGRPKRPEKSAYDLKIAELMSLYKATRKGRRRITSLPGDGRVNGMILSAITQLLPFKTDLKKVPHEASELVAAGIAEKDVGAVENMLNLPESNLNSQLRLPANLASLTGLRGLVLNQESVKVQTEQKIAEVNELCFGDPVEDKKLLLLFEKCFGWARPIFDTEAPVDGTEAV